MTRFVLLMLKYCFHEASHSFIDARTTALWLSSLATSVMLHFVPVLWLDGGGFAPLLLAAPDALEQVLGHNPGPCTPDSFLDR